MQKLKIPELFTGTKEEEQEKTEQTSPVKKEVPQKNDRKRFENNANNDDNQIDDYLKGLISNDYFYEYKGLDENGDSISYFDATFTGIMEMVKQQGNIILGTPAPEHTSDEYVYSIIATDKEKNVTSAGVGTAYKKINLSDKGTIEDRFARQRALTIATRNAYRHLINPDLYFNFFKNWYITKYKQQPNMSSIIIVGSSVNLNKYKND